MTAAAGSHRSGTVATMRFVRHLGEMLVAMFVGMGVLGGLWGLALAAAGTSSDELLDSAPQLVAVGLMVNMTVPMIVWMRYRGHSRLEIAEMAGAMAIVALIAVVLLSTSAIEPIAICGIECTLMIPAMVVAMLHRREAYAR
jgi:hypothetical protein